MNKKTPQARRLYFLIKNQLIYEKIAEFDFYSGFSLHQKQKTIESFHRKISDLESEKVKILEVSRKSNNTLGNDLSAFNLKFNGKYSVESLYQSSKVFNHNIQFPELLHKSPLEAKKVIREYQHNNNVTLTHFNFFGKIVDLNPKSMFYDYLYIGALKGNEMLSSKLLNYDCFTDIEFNQTKQISSQARSCALFVLLHRMNLLDEYMHDIDSFKDVYKFLMSKSYDLFDFTDS